MALFIYLNIMVYFVNNEWTDSLIQSATENVCKAKPVIVVILLYPKKEFHGKWV